MNYIFTSYITVHDPRQLHAAACQQMLDEAAESSFYPLDPVTHTNELLGTADAPDIGACLIMLLDPGWIPGCSINESSAVADGMLDVDHRDEIDPSGQG